MNILIEDSGHLFRYKSEVTPVKKKSKVRQESLHGQKLFCNPAARLQCLKCSQPLYLCTIAVSHYRDA